MGTTPSYFKGANLPVEMVSWYDAQQFLENLNDRLGSVDEGKMALPTEAQWEYAARAGRSVRYSDDSIDQMAWNEENSSDSTNAVGTKKPNSWGLHDMSGNVWEWCADRFERSLPGGIDPKGPILGWSRVIKGGSWSSKATRCRLAFRFGLNPTRAIKDLGFRVARISISQKASAAERA
jgi:formylglycine-generating enzyme required for sulfatase activity